MELTTAGQPDDRDDSISIDDLTLRFSRQDVDAAYERGAAGHVAELARVQVLLDHAQQRSIMVAKEAKDAYERGLAEGRRQAIEGLEREWGSQWVPRGSDPSGNVEPAGDEAEARRNVDEWLDHRVVSRLAGPWEPVDAVR